MLSKKKFLFFLKAKKRKRFYSRFLLF